MTQHIKKSVIEKPNIMLETSKPEYRFLYDSEYLGQNLMFITFGGSISYGLNTPESDVDIRGVCLPPKNTLFGCGFLDTYKDSRVIVGQNGFEQFNDAETDTTIYSFTKLIKLLYKCNPNTIEMLGCIPEHYELMSEKGKKLIENREVFLSKLAYDSFAGYARGQFQRLKNALGKDSFGEFSRTISLADSIVRLNKHLEMTYPNYSKDMLDILITDKSGKEIKKKNGNKIEAGDMKLLFTKDVVICDFKGYQIDPNEIEIRFNLKINNIPSYEFSSITNEINTTLKEFTKTVGHRNHKKDNYHLCKHAMHLIRLYLMGYDILTKHEIITFRKDEHDFLMDIKAGKYFTGTTFTEEFFEIVNNYDRMLEYAFKDSTLPDTPDNKKVSEFARSILYD